MGGANVTKAVYSRSLFEFDREGRTSSLYSTNKNMLKYLFKVEYSSEKFCSFFVILKEQFDYSFVKLTADIRSNIRSLQYLTPTTIRIRFRDEEGDFVNLPFDNCELFKEMLKSGHPVEDRDYTKIHLKVSELDSPANISAASQCGNRPVLEAEMQQRVQLRSVPVESDAIPIVKRAAPSSLHSKFDSVADEKQSDTQTPSPTRAATTNISPLERYASKLENDVKTQSQKIALLRENINDIDERLSQAKSAQIAGNLTVCGNCHLKLGHTARNCSLDACSDVFDCGFEKFHTRQINRTKLNQELKREETALQKLENELRTRRSAVRSLKETLTSQIENKLLRENGPDYHVGNFRNWSLLRRHVHLIETYCKRNFNGKIPPKQNLSYILGLAEADERQQQSLSQPKRRRVHENPAKSVLEMQHGVCFPNTSVQTTSLSALSCNSDLFRCEPRTEEEEEAQLDLALKASSCPTKIENQYSTGQYEAVNEMRHISSETVSVNNDVRTETEQKENDTDESNTANLLISLMNS